MPLQNSMGPHTIPTMPRLVQAPNLVMATLWVDWLRAEGIGSSVQSEYLRSASGELPPDQCLPEVWIEDGGHEVKALELLGILRHAPQRRWFCSCGELVEGGASQTVHYGRLSVPRGMPRKPRTIQPIAHTTPAKIASPATR
jgi:hypothetical protein